MLNASATFWIDGNWLFL